MVYMRVNCDARGTCNKKGPDRTCTKCGKRPTGGLWWYRFRFWGKDHPRIKPQQEQDRGASG
jgi:hypothetical protein